MRSKRRTKIIKKNNVSIKKRTNVLPPEPLKPEVIIPKNDSLRKIFYKIIISLLLFGGIRLIYFPISLNLTLSGIGLLIISIFALSKHMPDGQGAPLISRFLSENEVAGLNSSRFITAFCVLLSIFFFIVANRKLQTLNPEQTVYGGYWFIWVALLFLAFLPLKYLDRKIRNEEREDPSQWKKWHVFILLGVGAFFLFYHLDRWPNLMTIDGVQYMADEINFYSGHHITPFRTYGMIITGLPTMLTGLFFKIAGVSYFSVILFPVLITLICLPFLYGFYRYFLPGEFAFLGALLTVMSRWVLFQVRNAHVANLVVGVEAACLYFFISAIETGKKKYFIWFGLSLALFFHLYLAAQLMTVFLITFFLCVSLFSYKNILRNKYQWLFAWSIFVLFVLPLCIWYLQNPNEITSRPAEVNIFNHLSLKTEHGMDLLWNNFRDAMAMFNVFGTGLPNFNLPWVPMLDPLTGFCLWVGLAWCLFQLNKWPYFFAILGFSFSFIGVVLATPWPASPMRGITNVSFCLLFAMIGADRLIRFICLAFYEIRNQLRILLLVCIAGIAAFWNYDVYFQKTSKSPAILEAGAHLGLLAGQTLGKYPSGWDLYFTTQGELVDDLRYKQDMTYKKGTLHSFRPIPPYMPIQDIPEKGAVIMTSPDGLVFSDWFEYFYPRVKRYLVNDALDRLAYCVWEMTPDDIRESLKLSKSNPPGGVHVMAYLPNGRRSPKEKWPTLFDLQEWVNPWTDLDKCVVEGYLKLTNRPLWLKAQGRAVIYINNIKIGEIPAAGPSDFYFPKLTKKSHLRVEYTPNNHQFSFKGLFYNDGDWKPVPSSAWE